MTGEMSAAEVTRDNYPELFALRDALKRRGIASEPRPFDVYQGPYLAVPGVGAAWYADCSMVSSSPPGFTIGNPGEWEVIGAKHVHKGTQREYQHGCYTLRQAARRIAELAS